MMRSAAAVQPAGSRHAAMGLSRARLETRGGTSRSTLEPPTRRRGRTVTNGPRCQATSAPSRAAAPSPAPSPQQASHSPPHSVLAHEFIQGQLVRWSALDASQAAPPTVVMVHGVLGRRENLNTFARMVVKVLLVDLRGHGESAGGAPRWGAGPHTLEAASADVLALLRTLRIFPYVLVGHSFGGKVVMSMCQQFGPKLPRAVQVWALDTVPGYVRAGDHDGRDHPRDIIATLRGLPLPLPSRNAVTDALLAAGASQAVARWAATNLRPASAALGEGDGTGHVWNCDLDIIADLYANYESSSMWPLLEAAPQGLRIDFVRAERSNFRWSGSEEADIRRLGHRVHVLPESGHWVHADNPTGLLKIIQPSFDSIIAGKI